MRVFSGYMLLAAVLFLVVANFSSMRLKSAPPIGSGSFRWPWQLSDRYTRRGFVFNSIGLGLWVVGSIWGFID